MIGLLEDKRTEFKVKLTDGLEKEAIAFLNTDGGSIFIGIDDKGNVQGNLGNIDLLQRTIKDRLKDNIMPSILGLFDVVVNEINGKKYIQIILAKGNERPYYLRGMGMTPDSCFIRVGSAVESMNNETILNLFSKRTRNSLINMPSENLNKLQISILKLITNKPNITQEELARILDVNKRTIIRNFKGLLEEKYIERVGANKNGYWKINKNKF